MATVAVALVLVVELPAFVPDRALPAAPPNGDSMTFRTDATTEEIRAAGAQLLESYGPFAVARGPAASVALLASRGRYAEPLARASILELTRGPVDVAALPARPPTGWSVDYRGSAVGVVHFHAPIKPAWTDDLESRGLAVLRYMPQDAFVVRGPPADLQAVASLPYVDWAGPYQAGWKIRPGMPDGGIVDVRIVVLPGDDPGSIQAWLGRQGIPAAPAIGQGPGLVGAFGDGDFRWVRARIPASRVTSVAELPAVEFIDPVVPVHPWNAETDWVIQTNRTADYRYWTYGLDARGQVIGMADTGLDYDGNQFRESALTIVNGDIYNATDPTRRKVVRYVNMGVLTDQVTWPGGGGTWDPWSIEDSDHTPSFPDCTFGHGTAVASTVAGNDNGIGTSPNDGNALAAKIYLQDIGTVGPDPNCSSGLGNGDLLNYLPQDYTDLFGPPGLAYNDLVAPVRVHSDSWGGDTNVYDLQARMVDAFVWAHPDMTILFAAGNGGSAAGTVGSPGTAKDIVTVGGADNPDATFLGAQNDLASQSSRGPTVDGRIKPTIVTIFDGDSAMSDGDAFTGAAVGDAHWAGTSYATPAAAAAAAIVRQYFVDGWYPAGRSIGANSMNPSAALVRAMLIASGAQVTGSGTVFRSSTDTWPNNEQGFGRVRLASVLPIAAAGDTFRTQVVDGTSGLLTGDNATYPFHVGIAGPAKFVLAWSDYPGTIGAAKALVNDLDLEVTAPDGTLYRGNNFAPFAQGQSLPGGTFDTTNVEEAVILKSAMAGDWTVRVIGSNVPVGPQPFAVVATGNLDLSYGRVVLDRTVYSEADTIRIEVEDSDATSVVVHVASSVEPAGEDVTLTRGAPDEIWRATIRTAFGNATADGVLEVREADVITAVYQDNSPPHTATARASVLASGPTIHDVTVVGIGSTGATIQWTTNEPATTEVRYGTSPTPLPLETNAPDLVTIHTITLTKLSPDTLYYFAVTSRGRLRNATTDANDGVPYRFQTLPYGDVLLVVGGDSFPVEREASYAAALDANGWSWSLWRVAELGAPPLSVLQARRAVIWQVGLEQYPPFNVSERALIQDYLDGGGRLIISAHDAAWALGSTSATLPSPFATPETVAWVHGVLKTTFVCDPTTIVQVKGVTSDPISGAYTAGAPYTPHRDGAADDELTPMSAGGTASTMWTDDNQVQGCTPQNEPIGLRWVSSSPNGTAGVGAWGGSRSRLAYFAFEITGIDSTSTNLNPTSSTRAAILDAALRWLASTSATGLDRDHPDVNITSPNGGVLYTGTSIGINWTATAYGSGISIADFTLASSADAGRTWTTIATLPGSARSYAWNIGSAPNGNRYLVEIRTRDDGIPSLSGVDRSDTTFGIYHPGGDTDGPVLWAGSVRVDPRPPAAGLSVSFTATADDRFAGDSDIAAAELFLQTAPPTAGDSGSGLPMTVEAPVPGPLADVSWQGGLPVAPGATCAWVHARDAAGNWGAFGSTCFVVIFVGPDTVAPGFASPNAIRRANGNQDLGVVWLPAWDEGLYGGTTEYRVFRAAAPGGPYTDVSGGILANGSARYSFVDPGLGGDASDDFYRIETADAAGNRALETTLAVKIHVSFLTGLNLLGMPVDLTDPGFGTLAAGSAWSDAWTYDACAAGFGWGSAVPADATTFVLPAGRGFWLNGTAPDALTALGLLPETAQVRLCAGWNLIALPGLGSGVTVGDVRAATGADVVMEFDPAGPYHVRALSDSDPVASGDGYWVHVPADVDWVVAGW